MTGSRRAKSAAEVAVFTAKTRVLALARLAQWALRPQDYPAPVLAPPAENFPYLLYERALPIVSRSAPGGPPLEAGKLVNVALAASALDGLMLKPDRPFSFWRAVGRLAPALGYRPGASYQDGCVIPAVGGGICMLSNALFAMAGQLGWRILERHGHTLDGAPVPDAQWGLDATVFWPYVDLRFAPRQGQVQLGVSVRSGTLYLHARGTEPLRGAVELEAIDGRTVARQGLLFRENRIRLRLIDDAGATLAEEIIADNRKRLRAPGDMAISCLDCRERQCHLRDRALEGMD
jgi:vancomycin resistance protein VanW